MVLVLTILNSQQTLLSNNRHMSAINISSISCRQLTKHSHPHFSTSENTFRQFIGTPDEWFDTGQIVILSYDSLWSGKLKAVPAMAGSTP